MNLQTIKQCRECPLYKTRENVVIGRGTIPADVLFLGEAPGRSEDIIGKSFVGPSGKLLDKMILDVMALDGHPGMSYYICNCILCRPPDNREPTKEEKNTCLPNIEYIISLVKPKVITTVGGVAKKHFRRIADFHIQHPAFLLRQGGKAGQNYLHNIRTLEEAFTDAKTKIREKKKKKIDYTGRV